MQRVHFEVLLPSPRSRTKLFSAVSVQTTRARVKCTRGIVIDSVAHAVPSARCARNSHDPRDLLNQKKSPKRSMALPKAESLSKCHNNASSKMERKDNLSDAVPTVVSCSSNISPSICVLMPDSGRFSLVKRYPEFQW